MLPLIRYGAVLRARSGDTSAAVMATALIIAIRRRAAKAVL
jgi:hypothetical protein